jgi:hypothetical protein
MKLLFLVAGAAALALTGPALAKPGNGNGNGHGRGHDNAYGYGHGHGRGHDNAYGYGVGGCPPGLAKKHNGCLPPGQAKKIFRVGQRYNLDYGRRYSYGQIPYSLRNRYDLNSRYRYYYGDGYLYQVDPRTMLVQQAISALLR